MTGVQTCALPISDVGEAMVDDARVALISATGSTRMGRAVGAKAAARFAKTILELGGNNAMIVTPTADLKMVQTAALFSAVGTAGQRCTSLRRLIVHASIVDQLLPRLKSAYASIRIGNPLDAATLVGPLIDEAAFNGMQSALRAATAEGGVVTGGTRVLEKELPNGYYVQPAIVEIDRKSTRLNSSHVLRSRMPSSA